MNKVEILAGELFNKFLVFNEHVEIAFPKHVKDISMLPLKYQKMILLMSAYILEKYDDEDQ